MRTAQQQLKESRDKLAAIAEQDQPAGGPAAAGPKDDEKWGFGFGYKLWFDKQYHLVCVVEGKKVFSAMKKQTDGRKTITPELIKAFGGKMHVLAEANSEAFKAAYAEYAKIADDGFLRSLGLNRAQKLGEMIGAVKASLKGARQVKLQEGQFLFQQSPQGKSGQFVIFFKDDVAP